ncbi:MAG: hypothetical protein AVDCRST_MAG88-2482, partial [uncultured Thermomicrobiales bacterium]
CLSSPPLRATLSGCVRTQTTAWWGRGSLIAWPRWPLC